MSVEVANYDCRAAAFCFVEHCNRAAPEGKATLRMMSDSWGLMLHVSNSVITDLLTSVGRRRTCLGLFCFIGLRV